MKAEANTVDEQHVLDILEAALDYEKEVGRLDENSKGIVKKLQERVGGMNKPAEKRKKWMTPLHASLKSFYAL